MRRDAAIISDDPLSMLGRVPPDTTAPVIVTQQLTKRYPGADFLAVGQLDLTVNTGEIFGLLGPNGAGKTTTAGMLTTRVVPTSGRAFVGGVDVVAHPALVKQLTGIVSQQKTLDRQLTVWEDLYQAPRECSPIHGGGEPRHPGRRWDFTYSAITAREAPPAVPA